MRLVGYPFSIGKDFCSNQYQKNVARLTDGEVPVTYRSGVGQESKDDDRLEVHQHHWGVRKGLIPPMQTVLVLPLLY